jgi:hypothetical protein
MRNGNTKTVLNIEIKTELDGFDSNIGINFIDYSDYSLYCKYYYYNLCCTVRYIISMPIDKEYEKQFTEIQSLKKAVNNEKVAHQTTIDQLQNSCILNQ